MVCVSALLFRSFNRLDLNWKPAAFLLAETLPADWPIDTNAHWASDVPIILSPP